MLWLAGRGNRETLYNAALLIEIIWHRLKSLHYFEDRHKADVLRLLHFSALSTGSISSLFFPAVLVLCISGVVLITESCVFDTLVADLSRPPSFPLSSAEPGYRVSPPSPHCL